MDIYKELDKRGSAVHGIHLLEENSGYFEGRINGEQIVIITKFVKKSN